MLNVMPNVGVLNVMMSIGVLDRKRSPL